MTMIHRYLRKISGPLLDRIDLQVKVGPVATIDFTGDNSEERSQAIAGRVLAARVLQLERQSIINASLTPEHVKLYCKLQSTDQEILLTAMQKHQLSARAYDRIIKLARTIADLSGANSISLPHLSEAISLRCLDQDYIQ